MAESESVLLPKSNEPSRPPKGMHFEPPKWKEGSRCWACRKSFGATTRKHHCRACGQLFCASCSAAKRALPELGYKEAERVCDSCFRQPLHFRLYSLEEEEQGIRVYLEKLQNLHRMSMWFDEKLVGVEAAEASGREVIVQEESEAQTLELAPAHLSVLVQSILLVENATREEISAEYDDEYSDLFMENSRLIYEIENPESEEEDEPLPEEESEEEPEETVEQQVDDGTGTGPVLLEGMMKKKGDGVFAGYKDRFFQLKGVILAYYETEVGPEPRGTINLEDATVNQQAAGSSEGAETELVIKGPNAKRQFILVPPASHLELWDAVITLVATGEHVTKAQIREMEEELIEEPYVPEEPSVQSQPQPQPQPQPAAAVDLNKSTGSNISFLNDSFIDRRLGNYSDNAPQTQDETEARGGSKPDFESSLTAETGWGGVHASTTASGVQSGEVEYSDDEDEDDRITHEGDMMKKGDGFGGYKKRHFNLNRLKLDYYDTRGGNLKGSCNLSHAKVNEKSDGVQFQLSGPHMKRTFQLEAISRESRVVWVKKIRAAVTKYSR